MKKQNGGVVPSRATQHIVGRERNQRVCYRQLTSDVVACRRVNSTFDSFAMYQDDYATCEETYATLRIYHDELDPEDVSKSLRLVPTETQRKGDELSSRRVLPTGGWFLSSKGHVTSKDTRRHIAWVLDQLEPNTSNLLSLQDRGYEMDIFCFWASASGHGGPELDHELMRRLASFRLNIGFDVYC